MKSKRDSDDPQNGGNSGDTRRQTYRNIPPDTLTGTSFCAEAFPPFLRHRDGYEHRVSGKFVSGNFLLFREKRKALRQSPCSAGVGRAVPGHPVHDSSTPPGSKPRCLRW